MARWRWRISVQNQNQFPDAWLQKVAEFSVNLCSRLHYNETDGMSVGEEQHVQPAHSALQLLWITVSSEVKYE